MLKVIAINSSSRDDKTSKTKLMLEHLITGMRKAGAEVEIIDLRKKNIKHCIGCFSCWTETPGQCVLKDDMTSEIFSKWKNSDIAIYATPLFNHHMNALMSTFYERRLPAMLPFFETEAERTTHPQRYKMPKAIWLSVCGFPDISEFKIFSNYLNFSSKKNLIGEIYRAAAESMIEDKYSLKLNEILKASERAGKEIVKSQKISKETLSKITQPLDDYKHIVDDVNQYWNENINNS